jgi:predicted nuclease of predicted toxin-antitoxin system
VRLWLDANLDPALAPWLGSRFSVFVDHVRDLALNRLPDNDLFDAARRLKVAVIVSKDSDFVDLVTLRGPPPQIVRMTCGNLSTPAMHVLLGKTSADALVLLEAGSPWVEIG